MNIHPKNKGRLVAAALAAVLVLALCASALALASGIPFAPRDEKERHAWAAEAFLTAAFSAEYAQYKRDHLLRWQTPIVVALLGDYTQEDQELITAFVTGFPEKQRQYGMRTFPGIRMAQGRETPNLRITLCPYDQMAQHMESFYEPDNWGLFEYWYRGSAIHRANIVVASDKPTQEDRNHLLLEELVGALGLANDIGQFSDSILYKRWSRAQELSDVDWLMLSYLYHERMRPGMRRQQALRVLRNITPLPLERSAP